MNGRVVKKGSLLYCFLNTEGIQNFQEEEEIGCEKSEYNASLFLNSKKQNKTKPRDFSGGPVVKNPPSNAGAPGSVAGRGTKIPQAAGQQSPRAATTEPTHHSYRACTPQPLSLCVWSLRATTREKPTPQWKIMAQLRPNAEKNK